VLVRFNRVTHFMEKADYNREWLKNLGGPKEIR
jgi:hypothetical protein